MINNTINPQQILLNKYWLLVAIISCNEDYINAEHKLKTLKHLPVPPATLEYFSNPGNLTKTVFLLRQEGFLRPHSGYVELRMLELSQILELINKPQFDIILKHLKEHILEHKKTILAGKATILGKALLFLLLAGEDIETYKSSLIFNHQKFQKGFFLGLDFIVNLGRFDINLLPNNISTKKILSAYLGNLQLNSFCSFQDIIRYIDLKKTVYCSYTLAGIAALYAQSNYIKQLFNNKKIEQQLHDGLQCFIKGDAPKAYDELTSFIKGKINSTDIDISLFVICKIVIFLACITGDKKNIFPSFEMFIKGNDWTMQDFVIFKDTFFNNEIPNKQTAYTLNICAKNLLPLIAHLKSNKIPDNIYFNNNSFNDSYFSLGCNEIRWGRTILGLALLNSVSYLLNQDSDEFQKIKNFNKKLTIPQYIPIASNSAKFEQIYQNLAALLPQESQKNSSNKTKGKDEKIIWSLYLSNKVNGFETLNTISAFYRAKKKNGEWGVPRLLNTYSISCNKYKSAFLPEELPIINEAKNYWWSNYLPGNIIKFLQNSEVCIDDDFDSIISVQESKLPIFADINEDNSLELYFPSTSLERNKIIFWQEEDSYFFRIVDSEEELLTSKLKLDDSQQLDIPAEFVPKFTDLLKALSKQYAIRGSLEEDIYYSDYQPLDGNIELQALFERKENGVSFTIVNKVNPLLEEYCIPGIGKSLLFVSINGNKYRLERDLDAEKNAAEELENNLPNLIKIDEDGYNYLFLERASLLEILEILKEKNIPIHWKKGNPITVQNSFNSDSLKLKQDKTDWLSLEGEFQVSENLVLNIGQLINLYRKRNGNFIQISEDNYISFSKELSQHLETLSTAGVVNRKKLKLSLASLPMLANREANFLPEKIIAQVDKIKEVFNNKVEVPDNLNGNLRPYQKDGFEYLSKFADCNIGCILADDMGLGKTIQILTLLLKNANKGPALVICPASLTGNWFREAEKFTPSLEAIIVNSENRDCVVSNATSNQLLIISYNLLNFSQELFLTKEFHTVVIDEAQAIKNRHAQRSQIIKQLNAKVRIAATGTPVENHLLELWSIFDFLNPGMLGSAEYFAENFCNNSFANDSLKNLVSPLIMRRLKSDVLNDLPPKTEINLNIDFSEEEQAVYEALRRKAVEDLTKKTNDPNKIAMLAHLTKLRRACCHPNLVQNALNLEGSKLEKIVSLASELKENNHRALIFSQYVDFLQLIKDKFDKVGFTYQYLDGSTPQKKRLEAVDNFQNGIGDFFLISLKAGGTGLNLTEANYVILTDPWWNPAVENQAADRAHRIGQKNPVTVYRLITSNTIEEKVIKLHQSKLAIADDVLSGSQTKGISAEEIMELLS